MKKLLPYIGVDVPTKTLHELGYTQTDINKMLEDEILVRVKRGYYQVKIESDANLMNYYLNNEMLDDFKVYYDSLKVKDYYACYYCFLYDIMTANYSDAYKMLMNCCELNREEKNKIGLYVYVLLIDELMNLSEKKLNSLRNKLFNGDDSLKILLEYVLKKDYDGACESLKSNKKTTSLSRLELSIYRNLSSKARECFNKKNSKEMDEYNKLYDMFYNSILNGDFETGYYYFAKIYNLCMDLNIKDSKLDIINDLFNCFDYLVVNDNINLESYKNNIKYPADKIKAFYMALKKNDYVGAYKFISSVETSNNLELDIYRILLERIYNFLNIRSIISNHNKDKSLSGLIKDKKYKEALTAVNEKEMNNHDKNMVTSLLESILAIDDKLV